MTDSDNLRDALAEEGDPYADIVKPGSVGIAATVIVCLGGVALAAFAYWLAGVTSVAAK